MEQGEQPNAFHAELTALEDESEFLTLDPEIREKLDNIDRMRMIEEEQDKENAAKEQEEPRKRKKPKKVEAKAEEPPPQPVKRVRQSLEEIRRNQQKIKDEFKGKLKAWGRQRQELSIKKHIIEEKRAQKKAEDEQRKRDEAEEAREFERERKKRQLEQKISDIEERRRRREESLKNAVLKRSYHGFPKFLEYEKKFSQEQQQKAEIDFKALRNRKERMKMDPESLKKHEKAYIQRIKDRLQMRNGQNSPAQRRTSSDFNLYLKRSEELKREELNKIIRRKKFEERLGSMRVRVDHDKQQEVLIAKDKAKHQHKYNLLGQKGLTDRQIYEDFQDVDIVTDSRQIGNNYLMQQRSLPKSPPPKRKTRSLAALPSAAPSANLVVVETHKQQAKSKRRGSVQLPKVSTSRSTASVSKSQQYSRGLDRTRHQDQRYFQALNAKLSAVL